MTLQTRDLDRSTDLPKIMEFLRSRRKWNPLPDYWTNGSKMVLYLDLFEGLESNHHLWESESGELHAYAELNPKERNWKIQAHPECRDEEHLVGMIDEAEEFLDSQNHAGDKRFHYQTSVLESDALLISILEARGYKQGKYGAPYFRQPLDSDIPQIARCGDFVVREFLGGAETEQRAAAQRDSYTGIPEADTWSIRNIERMIQYRKFNEDFDLIAINADGMVGSYAVCEIDHVTKIGEFDPLGTRSGHRRKGLATAVIQEGLRRMKEKGMESAVVRTEADKIPAIKLYESNGFAVVEKLFSYVKPTG